MGSHSLGSLISHIPNISASKHSLYSILDCNSVAFLGLDSCTYQDEYTGLELQYFTQQPKKGFLDSECWPFVSGTVTIVNLLVGHQRAHTK